jgi:hypothetical protein
VLPRRAWIAPAAIEDADAVEAADDCRKRIDAHFAASSQAQLVAGLEQGGDGIWRETVRIFVVASHWPRGNVAA